MATLTFDIPGFRIAFPAFSDPAAFPDMTLQAYWDTATIYINPTEFQNMQGARLSTCLNLMTAHIAQNGVTLAEGDIPLIIQSAGVDRVNVGLLPPPVDNQWQWWLNTTPYGSQLLALLQVACVGGFYVGGLPETVAFRRVAGIFY